MAIAEAELGTGTRLTEDQFLRLPKDGRDQVYKYELVDGRLKEVPTSVRHDEIGINLILLFGPTSEGEARARMGRRASA